MLDSKDLVRAIKIAAVEAVDSANPTALKFGTVISASPLKINVEQKMTLTSAQLVLTRNVTNFKTKAIINWTSDSTSGGSGDSSFESHNHQITGEKEITINNALQVGEKVLLIAMQGGQKFFVIDRL